jgi:hypothetical protein
MPVKHGWMIGMLIHKVVLLELCVNRKCNKDPFLHKGERFSMPVPAYIRFIDKGKPLFTSDMAGVNENTAEVHELAHYLEMPIQTNSRVW